MLVRQTYAAGHHQVDDVTASAFKTLLCLATTPWRARQMPTAGAKKAAARAAAAAVVVARGSHHMAADVVGRPSGS